MNICFLSHSSKDKLNYVQIVANKIPKDKRIFDSDTFESGMKTLDEILSSLQETSLFVLFLSESALQSEWVKREITEAHIFLNGGNIKRIYPIIIDKNINYQDPRIPDWIRDEYNLTPITRPTVAAKRIVQKLRELSWESHPRLKERQKNFVGRNVQITKIEERFDDYNLSPLTCIICSGLQLIGRKTLIKNSITKILRKRESYIFPEIRLTTLNSIEDFIINIRSLGFSKNKKTLNLLEITLDDKINIAVELCSDLSKFEEVLLIDDSGCIITPENSLVDWFLQITSRLSQHKKLIFAIASRFRLRFEKTQQPNIYFLTVPELTKKERTGLFKRVAEFEGLTLTSDDYAHFEDFFHGLPSQVFYAVNLIKEKGVHIAKEETYLISDFNIEHVSHIVKYNIKNEYDKYILSLLSEFDFISFDFLDTLIDPQEYRKTLERFMGAMICETLGANGEVIRVNDTIRDYVRRIRMPISEEHKAKLEEHVKHFIKSYTPEDIDASDYFFSISKALINGQYIDAKHLIPSHFLKAMKDLYDRDRSYKEVIVLADRVLESEKYLDKNIIFEIRYFLFQSLARTKSVRFLSEIQSIRNRPEYNFLLGFYYRMCGRYHDAIQQQRIAIKNNKTASRSRRELVQLYIGIENFNDALLLAEQNYRENPLNPFHIQAYLKCLINMADWKKNEELIKKLLAALFEAGDKFERANEMHLDATSQYEAYCLLDYPSALKKIEDAIISFPKSPYPLFTKINILLRQKEDFNSIEQTIKIVEKKIQSETFFQEMLKKIRIKFLSLQGKDHEANRLYRTLPKKYEKSLY